MLAGRFPRNGVGKRMRSIVRRLVTAGGREPYDIEVFPGVRARVYPHTDPRTYPHTNVSEKRVFVAPQLYDWSERRALSEAMAHSAATPFVFIDLGANVGVYTLWMVSEARRLGQPLKALAVEPDPETFGRLSTNLSLSEADEATALQCAVGEEEGRGHIVHHPDNRGQHRIELGRTAKDDIAVLPLHALCEQHGLSRIDAVKIDLEGFDHAVLSVFFATAPVRLWPNWIVAEVGKQAESPVIDLCEQHGYRLMERTNLNAILRHPGAEDHTS